MINASQMSVFGLNRAISLDPRTISDIHQMPTTQNYEDLQMFLGAMNFLSPYISNFSDKSAPLGKLQMINTPFLWQEDLQAALTATKPFQHSLVYSITTLIYPRL